MSEVLHRSFVSLALFLTLIAVVASSLARPGNATAAPLPPRFGAVDAHLDPERAREANVTWTRLLIWWRAIQPDGPETWHWGHVPEAMVDREIAEGREVVGLLISTPSWASDGGHPYDPPRGLYLPVDDPGNSWARFTEAIAARYRGRIDTWIIWNEPDVWDATAGGYTWSGSVSDFYQLQRVAYLAIKRVNPEATVTTPGFTYWWDEQFGRPQYFERLLEVAAADPTAPSNHWYFDAVVLQLYNNPRGLYEIPRHYRQILERFGITAPIWINETNVAPWNDAATPLTQENYRATLREQAEYVVQASALALAAGVERLAVYKWKDDPFWWPGAESYGLVRADGSTRPVYDAYRTVTTYFADAQRASLDHQGAWSLVTVERPNEWVSVLWNNSLQTREIRIEVPAASARIVHADGGSDERAAVDGFLSLSLDPATHTPVPGHPEVVFVGGPTLLVVQPKLGTHPPIALDVEDNAWVSPTTGKRVSGPWRRFYERCGGPAVWGEPLTDVIRDPQTGQPIQVFERIVLEAAPSGSEVRRRLIGDHFFPGGEPPMLPTTLPSIDLRYFPLSSESPTGLGHYVADVAPDGEMVPFKTYFEQHCGIETFGYPKGPPRSIDGRWEQHFQAAVLVYEPSAPALVNPADEDDEPIRRVHVAPLGARYLDQIAPAR